MYKSEAAECKRSKEVGESARLYLKLTRHWTRAFDNSSFVRVVTHINASFASRDDGKGQSGCVVTLGNTVVHEVCWIQKIVTRDSTRAELIARSNFN
jgi:hypothetical protein